MKLEVLKLAKEYIRPEIKESPNKDFVMNGENNQMYKDIIASYYGSPTNSAIIDSYARYIYGLGLNIKQNFISKTDLRKICFDMVLFGEASFEVTPKGNLYHIEKNKLLPNKAEDGEIRAYWFCFDWDNQQKYPPKRIPTYGFGKKTENQVFVIKANNVGQFYFGNPSYISALPYCEVESELANYYVNHIKNGMSFGHVINVNGGKPESEEDLNKFSRQIRNQLTGSTNAGKFLLSFNDNKESETTISALQVSDAHKQYDFLTQEAQNKICIAHKVVSGAILGITKSTGFSSNADEIETAFNETYLNVIQPIQENIIDAIEFVKGLTGLEFLSLRQKQTPETALSLSKKKEGTDLIADELINLGEEINDEEWELIDEVPISGEPTFGELELKLAKVPSSFPNVTSEQDTSLFKIRYSYGGNPEGQREFCNKMIKANKVYRKEDIELAGSKVVNPGFGPEGADTYNLFFYKGGVNCKHFWMRKIYLRKGNNSISVNEARKMILALDPADRPKAKWEENDKLVAQPAQASNNYFRLE
jgi:hypothetical protein